MAVTLLNQTLDTDLTAVGDLTGAGLLARTGNGTAAVRSIAAGTGVTVTNGDGVSGNPTVSLDADLTVIAGLTPTDNGVIIGDGSAWTVETGSTLRTSLGLAIGTDVQGYSLKLASYAGGDAPSSFVLGIVDAVDAAAFRSAIGVGAGTGDVVAANNLSDLANAATARTNLGLAIGTNVQPYDADLTTWAGLTPSAYFQTLVDDADAATARATLGLSIGSQVQAYDADLTTWAGVTPGTGVATALAVAVGSAGAVVVNGGALGTPSSGTLTSATGLPISTGVSGLGTGIATALAVNVGSAGAPVINGGALGTPSSGTLTNATGLPVGGISGLGTGVATFLATPSSANLAAAVTDETGSGALYFTGGALGTPSSATLTNATGLPVSGITASTSTALGVGSIELGHASDTTLSRVSAGVVAIEGVEVTTNTAAQTLTNKTLSSPTLSGTVAGTPTYSSTQTFPSIVSNGSVAISYANPDTNGIAMTATTGTNAAGMKFVNTGGNYFFGADNSAGARLQGSGYSSAYAFVLNAESARDFLIGTNNVTRLKIDGSTGAAAFSSTVTIGGVAVPTISSTDTLSNKTLSSPTVSGTIAGGATWTGTQALNGGITQTSTYPYITMIDTDSTSGSRSAVIQINADSWLLSKNGDGGAYVSDLLKINLTTTVANFIVAPTANGVAIPTISSTDTLSNKTLSSPTLSGTVSGSVTASGGWTFSSTPTQFAATSHGIEIGAVNTSNTPFIDFHSSATFNDYDVRLIASGTSASSGNGTLNITAGVLQLNGVAVPTISSTDTLSNKTLSSPTLSGTVAGSPTFSGACTFPNLTTNSNGFSRIVHQDGGTSIWSAGLRDDNDANYYLYQESGAGYVSISGGGVVIGSPTGGAKGAGTLNCTAAYDDNSLLTCYPIEAALDGTVDLALWDTRSPTGRHDGAHRFTQRLGSEYDPLDIDKFAAHWREKRHLTTMPNKAKYDWANGTLSTGEWVQRLIETVEIQAVHIENLNQRLKELEQ